MKLSVIVPIYNCEPFLPACLDSILAQTYTDLEIILVDDGSPDQSPQICNEYEKADRRIKVIHQDNQGVSAARNAGLRLASGELISFIDSDDTLEPDMYELLVAAMQDHDADISHCGFNRVENGVVHPIYDTRQTVLQTSEEAVRCLITGKLFTGSLWNKLFRTSLLEGLSFYEALKINEDIQFAFEAFRRANRIVFSDYAKYNYVVRKNHSACFTTPNEKKLSDSLWVNRYMYEALSGSDLKDAAAERYLRCLSGYYRYCAVSKKADCGSTASTIWDVAKSTKALGRNMRLTANLVHYCPGFYCRIYSVYDRIRKPKWEI